MAGKVVVPAADRLLFFLLGNQQYSMVLNLSFVGESAHQAWTLFDPLSSPRSVLTLFFNTIEL